MNMNIENIVNIGDMNSEVEKVILIDWNLNVLE